MTNAAIGSSRAFLAVEEGGAGPQVGELGVSGHHGLAALLTFLLGLSPARPRGATPSGSPGSVGAQSPCARPGRGAVPAQSDSVPTWELSALAGWSSWHGAPAPGSGRGGEGKARGDRWITLAAHVSRAEALMFLRLSSLPV